MKTSETLHAAADFIEVNGWGQGPSTWGGQNGAFCIEGGLAAVAGIGVSNAAPDRKQLEECPAYRAVQVYLGDNAPAELWEWNDDLSPITGQAEVIEVLRACALIEETREKVAYATITLENQC